MKKLLVAIAIVTVIGLAAPLWAATTGGIQGTVRDAQTNQPLIGASVAVVDTRLGAITDEEGRYSIIRVPVGDYTLRFSSVGYTTVEIAPIGVSADIVTFQDAQMQPATTETQSIRVVGERPMIVQDQSSAINIIRGDDLRAMPIRGFEQVVGIQTGVVKMQTNLNQLRGLRGARESLNTPELNIRGGRPSEVAYYVDGYSQQDPLTGTSTAMIANNAVKEVTVISGGFPVEYGHVTSGVVNVITQSATDRWRANAETIHDVNYGQRWYALDAGGPVPGIPKASFFGSGEVRNFDDRSPSAVAADILPGDRDQLPGNWLESWSGQGKLDYRFTPNVGLALSGTGSRVEWQEYLHSYLFNSKHMPYYDDRNLGLNAKFTHMLNDGKTFYELGTSYFMTSRFRGDGVEQDDLWAYGRPDGNPRYENTDLFYAWDNFNGPTGIVRDTMTVDGVVREFIVDGDEGHVYEDFFRRKASYIGFSGLLTSELNSDHTMKAGFELQRHTLRFYRHYQPQQVHLGISGGFNDVDRYGYDLYGEESDDEGWENEAKHPINFALFAQDRFQLSSFIITAGLRFDYFDYEARQLRNPLVPLNPDSLGFDGHPGDDGTASTLELADTEESEKFTRLSPRLGIAFPISDRTQMRFNYGKFFQRPELQNLYVGYDFLEYKVNSGGGYVSFGNPNLEPPKTTAYEIGLSHMLTDNTAFDINLYYRDVTDLVQVYYQPSLPRAFATYQNSDYGTIQGMEFQLRMRRTRHMAFDLKYSLQSAKGTGSYVNTAANVAWVNSTAPKQTAPLDYDQRHTLTGLFDIRFGRNEGPVIGDLHPLENFGLNILMTSSSGLPYTPIYSVNEASEGAFAPIARDRRNSSNGPWIFQIDLKAEKTFKWTQFNVTPYLWVTNLLDRDNVVGVWESTGRANTTGWLETPPGQEFVTQNADATDDSGLNGEEKYNIKQVNPQNYATPRQIMFGLRVSF